MSVGVHAALRWHGGGRRAAFHHAAAASVARPVEVRTCATGRSHWAQVLGRRVRCWCCIWMIANTIFKESSTWVSCSEVNCFLWLVDGFCRTFHPLAALKVSLLEHLFTCFVKCPVVALTIPPFLGNFNKALVQGEVVSDGVLPAFLVLCIVRKVVHDELIDPTQSKPLVWRLCYGHCNQSHIRVRRLDVFTTIIVSVDSCKE